MRETLSSKESGFGRFSRYANPSYVEEKGALVCSKRHPTGSIRVHKLSDRVLDGKVNDFQSYTMYVSTNESCNSNMFGWFFENLSKSNAKLLLWLEGGPGASSVSSLFTQNGPWSVTPNLTLESREYAWTNDYHVLYIDNPIGTGFSYTDNRTECYAHNEDDVARDLYTFLTVFFKQFSKFKQTPFYITGESYAGKYIPAIANLILQNKNESSQYFNFQGIAIGDGFVDPVNQVNSAELLYQIALVDEAQRDNMTAVENLAIQQINEGKWLDAYNSICLLVHSTPDQPSLFSQYTGLNNLFNFLNTNNPISDDFIKFLNLPSTRKWIGVGNQTFGLGFDVRYYMREDIPQSTRHLLENILNANVPVLLYSGQLDIIVAPILTENFLKKTNWNGADDFAKASRTIWRVNSTDAEVAGYVKQAHNLQYVVVRNGGHILLYDQPRAAYDMLNRFIEKLPFTN